MSGSEVTGADQANPGKSSGQSYQLPAEGTAAALPTVPAQNALQFFFFSTKFILDALILKSMKNK